MGKYYHIVTGDEMSVDELKALTLSDFSNPDDDAIVYQEREQEITFTGREIVDLVKHDCLYEEMR